MTPRSHARPADDGPAAEASTEEGADEGGAADKARSHRRRRAWRIGTPLVVLLCGGLFVVSAENSEGTDLRPGRYIDLASLVSNEARDYRGLQQRVKDLNTEVAGLTDQVDDTEVQRYQRKIEKLKDPAGLVPRSGPGVTVTLSDAPEEVINSTTHNLNYLVVHQQDIQAVVNAMWKAGATAVTVQGQRVVSTTGIKCEGNAVQLQGVPYSQPYRISAVGDQAALLAAIDSDPYLQVYRQQADDPTISVGWDLQTESDITAPAYDGLLDLNYAKPLAD